MKRGFSASTMVLVVLLLSVLYFVGKIVNPPVKGGHDDHDSHDEQPAATKQAPPPTPRTPPNAMADKARRQPAIAASKTGGEDPRGAVPLHPAMPKPPATKPPPPKSDGMDASYWQEHEMGAVTAKPDAKPQ